MRRLLLLLATPLVLLPAPAASAQETGPQVVVVGAAGLRWDDVTPGVMPTLTRLVEEGAVGALSVKALPAITCPADGWLTLGAGARAEASDAARDPCGADLPAVGGDDVRRNASSRDSARLGALADALGGLDVDGAGAALAADPAGGDDRRVRIVDVGTIDDRERGAREPALREVDARLSAQVSRLPAGADLLVVGLSESPGVPGSTEQARLHVAVAVGPSFDRGTLRSASTRRDGYVQLIDVTPTVLDLLDVDAPEEVDGEPWRSTGDALSVEELVDLDTRAAAGKRVTVPFFVTLLVGQALLLGGLALARRTRAVRLAALAATAAPGVSFAAMLVPWWRIGEPFFTLLGLVLVGSFAVALLAVRTSSPVGLVCSLTAAVISLDLITGAHLQIESPAGYSSLVAGRFAGLGNVALGVLGAAALLALASLGQRHAGDDGPWRESGQQSAQRVAFVLVGVAHVVVVGVWGSDVGGVLALVPALTVLFMLVFGIRVSVLRLLLAGAAGAAIVTVFALADWSRDADERTHLGRFVQDVADGTAGEVLRRKAEAVFGLLFANPVTALLPLVVAAVVLVFLRPPPALARTFEALPSYRHALVAVGLLCLVGFAVNDSGAAVVALAVVVVVPATIAVAAGVSSGQERSASP